MKKLHNIIVYIYQIIELMRNIMIEESKLGYRKHVFDEFEFENVMFFKMLKWNIPPAELQNMMKKAILSMQLSIATDPLEIAYLLKTYTN